METEDPVQRVFWLDFCLWENRPPKFAKAGSHSGPSDSASVNRLVPCSAAGAPLAFRPGVGRRDSPRRQIQHATDLAVRMGGSPPPRARP